MRKDSNSLRVSGEQRVPLMISDTETPRVGSGEEGRKSLFGAMLAAESSIVASLRPWGTLS